MGDRTTMSSSRPRGVQSCVLPSRTYSFLTVYTLLPESTKEQCVGRVCFLYSHSLRGFPHAQFMRAQKQALLNLIIVIIRFPSKLPLTTRKVK